MSRALSTEHNSGICIFKRTKSIKGSTRKFRTVEMNRMAQERVSQSFDFDRARDLMLANSLIVCLG